MSTSEVFIMVCIGVVALALTCVVVVWAVKNILEWLDDINDAVDTLKYTFNKRKKEREAKTK